MNAEEYYKYRINNKTKEEIEKSKKHNCDGLCYTCYHVCPRIDYCTETRTKEFFATVLAGLFYLILLLIANPITWVIITIIIEKTQ